MTPSPITGPGFETRTHPQQFAQSSASPVDPTFRILQQARQFYFQHQQAALQNGVNDAFVSMNIPLASCDTDMVEQLAKEDRNVGQPIQNYVQENLSAAHGLIRYHSAPSSMLASLTGMGDAMSNQGAQLCQFLSNSALPVEAKGPFKHVSVSHSLANDDGDSGATHTRWNRCDATGASHDNGLISSCTLSSDEPVSGASGGEHNCAGIGTDLKGKTLMFLASDGPVESSTATCPPRSSFLPKLPHLESDNGIANGVPNSLLRQSSSPAGLLHQLNDNSKTHMLGLSSGNSSEDGSYGKYTWDEAGNMILGSPNASCTARKRIRDLEEKYFPGSTLKGEEHGVLGNYFGLQAATSPENIYVQDKLSPDSVLCRARAKRGCATDPRSIAERNRRIKISERMKKLQELVPNMDKQTNIAEMLDEAVEYVKYLHCQVQELTENRAKCKCSCGESKENSCT